MGLSVIHVADGELTACSGIACGRGDLVVGVPGLDNIIVPGRHDRDAGVVVRTVDLNGDSLSGGAVPRTHRQRLGHRVASIQRLSCGPAVVQRISPLAGDAVEGPFAIGPVQGSR